MDQARTARLLFCPNTKNVFLGETAIFLWRHHRKTQSASRAIPQFPRAIDSALTQCILRGGAGLGVGQIISKKKNSV